MWKVILVVKIILYEMDNKKYCVQYFVLRRFEEGTKIVYWRPVSTPWNKKKQARFFIPLFNLILNWRKLFQRYGSVILQMKKPNKYVILTLLKFLILNLEEFFYLSVT